VFAVGENRVTRADVTARGVRSASSMNATLLGVLVVVSQAAEVWLSILAHQGDFVAYFAFSAVTFVFGAVGVVVARREPQNPVGWMLAGIALLFIVCTTGAANYLALDYGTHDGALPFGSVAIILGQCWPIALLLGPIAILLFPDGRLTSRAWRWLLGAYLVSAAALVADQLAIGLSAIIEQRVGIDSSGYLTSPSPRILSSGIARAAAVMLIAFVLASALAFVGRQVVSYRHASGEPRQQLKWVMCGAAITAVSIFAFVAGGNPHGLVARLLVGASVFGLAALPLGIGVGILKYRLYEIDRLISRTLAYAIVTGLLVGVYFGVVALTTRALPLSSPVGVAASTLAAAALFNPLRRHVQRLVDRRFNRARYDAEATLATFTTQLRDAIDLDSVGSALVHVVIRAVEPAHASLWINPHVAHRWLGDEPLAGS
jgi:hypothetical protein